MTPKVSLILPTHNGLSPYKMVPQMLQAARDRGLETVVGVDRKTTDGTYKAIRHLIDRYVEYDCTRGIIEENMNEIVDRCRTEWCLWVCDDEMPSRQLWEFAASAPKREKNIYRPHLLSPLPGWTASYKNLNTYQPRLFPLHSVRWVSGGLDRLPLRTLPEKNLDEVLWHFNLWASRESRERKTAAHEAMWMEAWEYHPWESGSRMAYLYEDFPNDIEPLDPWSGYRL